MLKQIATNNADVNLATGANVYNATPDANNIRLVQAIINLGDGTKNLDGTGGDFTVKITVGSQVVDAGGVTKTLGTEVRAQIQTEALVVPANTALAIHVTSPNAGDTDVDATCTLYDAASGNIVAINDDTTAPVNLALSASEMQAGTVSHDNTAATNTVFYSDDITEATADHYNGRLIVFTSGALQKQMTRITDYSLDTGEGKFTVDQLTEAPADNVTFLIV